MIDEMTDMRSAMTSKIQISHSIFQACALVKTKFY